MQSTYTASTRTELTTSPAGRQTRKVMDADGRVIQQQLGNLTPTEYSYDADGRIDGIAQGARITSMTYDGGGRLAAMTDPLARTVGFAYDDAGRVTSQSLPDGRSIAYTYDPKGNLTSITPPGRPAHGFTYNRNSQERSYLPPQPDPPLAVPQTTYGYNLMGQLKTITRPDGQTIAMAYDVSGRLAVQTMPAGASCTVRPGHRQPGPGHGARRRASQIRERRRPADPRDVERRRSPATSPAPTTATTG